MFVYKSPKGGAAYVDSIEPGLDGLHDFDVHWAGGGIWAAQQHQIEGRMINAETAKRVDFATFSAKLRQVLGETEPGIESGTTTERVVESVADLTETE